MSLESATRFHELLMSSRFFLTSDTPKNNEINKTKISHSGFYSRRKDYVSTEAIKYLTTYPTQSLVQSQLVSSGLKSRI